MFPYEEEIVVSLQFLAFSREFPTTSSKSVYLDMESSIVSVMMQQLSKYDESTAADCARGYVIVPLLAAA